MWTAAALALLPTIVFVSSLFPTVVNTAANKAEQYDAGSAKLIFDEVQQVRQRRLDVECRRLRDALLNSSRTTRWLLGVPSPNALIINARRRTAFCVVRKAASTDWLRVLLSVAAAASTADPTRLTAGVDDRSAVQLLGYDYALRTNRDRSDEELRRIMDAEGGYFKVVFVRDPLERLVSAFLEQVKADAHYMEVRRSVVGQSRHLPSSNVSDEAADSVTFVEFVRYVLDTADLHPFNPLDDHWRPQHEVCSPCTVHYDFIGHHETLLSDAEQVLPRLAGRQTITFSSPPPFPSSSSESGTGGKMADRDRKQQLLRRMFKDVPSRDTRRLLELYEIDYKLFGFRFPPDFIRGV